MLSAPAAVFLDFDGTVAVRDVGEVLLEHFGGPDWRRHGRAFAAGLMGSRQTMEAEWAELADRPADDLMAVARSVDLDPDAAALVVLLRSAGHDVTVVSDGFGFYVEALLADHGIDVDVMTNAVDWTTGELVFPNLDLCCACSSCGTCKQAPIRAASAAGRITVFVGDGPSDRKAALLADRLLATGTLAQWCEDTGVAFEPFRDLDDVGVALLGPHWRAGATDAGLGPSQGRQ